MTAGAADQSSDAAEGIFLLLLLLRASVLLRELPLSARAGRFLQSFAAELQSAGGARDIPKSSDACGEEGVTEKNARGEISEIWRNKK